MKEELEYIIIFPECITIVLCDSWSEGEIRKTGLLFCTQDFLQLKKLVIVIKVVIVMMIK